MDLQEKARNEDNMYAIAAQGLSKHYGKTQALSELSMHVPRQSVYGLLGVNGAGKTTTFGLLAGYLPRERGQISIRGRLSILPQDARLYPQRCVGEQLAFFARLGGIASREATAKVREVLTLTGMEAYSRRKAGTLSHGMAKKVAFSQALLGDPEILLLDEPTAGLDPASSSAIRQLIIELGKRRTVIVSSHILTEIAEMCSMVGIIHEGRMKYEGALEEITGYRSIIRYRVSGKLRAEDFQSIEGVLGSEFLYDREELVISYDGLKISVTDLNREVIARIFQKNKKAGIREIIQGESLEAGFLKQLGL